MSLSLKGTDKSNLGLFWGILAVLLFFSMLIYPYNKPGYSMSNFYIQWLQMANFVVIALMLMRSKESRLPILASVTSFLWLINQLICFYPSVLAFESTSQLFLPMAIIASIVLALALMEVTRRKSVVPSIKPVMGVGFGVLSMGFMIVYAVLKVFSDWFVHTGLWSAGFWAFGILLLSLVTMMDITMKQEEKLYQYIAVVAVLICAFSALFYGTALTVFP